MSELSAALAAWRDLLGAEHVRTAPEELRGVETATFLTRQRVPGVIRPAAASEVQECLRIASRFRVPVYPISGGKNWGYGSRVPVESGCVLLDLGRMDRILDYSEELAYVTVEPGVTFRQLHGFLLAKGSRLMAPVTGSSPDGSVLGNAIERGIGIGPQASRFDHVCDLEVVLPTGERVRTGFGGFPDCRVAPLHRWGVGPSVDGLFSQSNFGVVTRLTAWLPPRPGDFQLVYFATGDERLEALIDGLRALRVDGRFDIRIENHHRLGASAPRGKSGRLLQRLLRGRPAGSGSWHGLAGLYARDREEGRLLRRWLAEAVEGKVEHFLAIDRRIERAAELLEAQLSRLGIRAGMTMNFTHDSPWVGTPAEAGLHFAYAATPELVRSPGPVDLDRDRCGVLWTCPVVPFEGAEVRRATRLVEEVMKAHGFLPHVNMRLVSSRAIDAVSSMIYDRGEPGADERALVCGSQLLERLTAAGYPPYRLGIHGMETLEALDPVQADLLSRLKEAVDPGRVLAPGRYEAPRPARGS